MDDMDMDDDDRIVYGWDFSVTQQEQEQQDKRILGVRMLLNRIPDHDHPPAEIDGQFFLEPLTI